MSPNPPDPGVVVIAVEGGEETDQPLRYGVAEAVRDGRPVRLVHVLHEAVPLTPMLPMFGADTLRAVGTGILADAQALAHELAGRLIAVDQVLAHGPAADAILQHAEDAAVIVLGSRPSTTERLWTGSTTTGVAARAQCPVVTVPEGWKPGHERGWVVAGVDGSPPSAEVIGAAFAAAHDRGAGLVVLHAWRPTGAYDEVAGPGVAAEAWARQVEPAVWALVAGWRADYPEVEVQVELRYQDVAGALAEASRHADLLVIGRRGERAPHGLALGSRARAMLRVAGCPVLVVPAPQVERPQIPLQAAGRQAERTGRAAT